MEKIVDELQTSTTRRTVIRTGAKMAYAAPLVAASFKLSSTAVGAQQVSGGPNPECAGSTCGSFTSCSSGNPDCVCASTNQGGLCIPGSTNCENLQDCVDGACPDGSLCAVNTCCGRPVCVSVDLECAGSGATGLRTSGARTSSGPGTIGG
jgi:hypothetical protein